MTDASQRRSRSRVVSGLLAAYSRLRAAIAGRWRGKERSEAASNGAPSRRTDGGTGERRTTAMNGGTERARERGREEEATRDEREAVSLVSPEERVRLAVEEAEDWTPQSEIVDAVDISSSSVSRHLSSLEERGEIRRVRVGRQKIVGLADAELDAVEAARERPDRHGRS